MSRIRGGLHRRYYNPFAHRGRACETRSRRPLLITPGTALRETEKCAFGLREVKSCGFLISAQGISSHPDKLKSIREWPTPANVNDARAFFGLAGFYRRFVRNFEKRTSRIPSRA